MGHRAWGLLFAFQFLGGAGLASDSSAGVADTIITWVFSIITVYMFGGMASGIDLVAFISCLCTAILAVNFIFDAEIFFGDRLANILDVKFGLTMFAIWVEPFFNPVGILVMLFGKILPAIILTGILFACYLDLRSRAECI